MTEWRLTGFIICYVAFMVWVALFTRPTKKETRPVTFCVSFMDHYTAMVVPSDADCSYPNVRNI